MANPRLVQYIEKELAKNFPREQIKQVLVKYNYNEADIDEAFRMIDEKASGTEAVSMDEILATAPPKKKHFGLIVVAILAIIGIAFSAMYFTMRVQPLETDPMLEFNDTDLIKSEPLPFDIPESEYTYFEGMVDTCVRQYMLEEGDETTGACASEISGEDCDDECKSRVNLFTALMRSQKTICQNIPMEDIRKACHAILDNDPEKCAYYSNPDDVKYCRALVTGNGEECLGLEESEHCLSEMLEIAAISKNDAALCMNISSVGVKNECLAFLRDDIKECYHYTYCADEAYQNIASLQNNREICQKIWNTDIKGMCNNLQPEVVDAGD